jgi:hypothetical protein
MHGQGKYLTSLTNFQGAPVPAMPPPGQAAAA